MGVFMPVRSKIGEHIVFVLSVILSFCNCHSVLLSETLTLFITFETVSARALIFHMSILCDKTFPWVPLFFTQWPWPWSLTHFYKTLTLQITFEQWVLELWYFTWVFFVIRASVGTIIFYPVTLTLKFKPFFENFNLANNFWTVSARLFVQNLLTLTFDLFFFWHWS